MATVIVIVNPRQHSGKTAMAVNVAAGLALLEKKTLLIDSDPQGGATVRLSKEAVGDRSGLDRVLTDGETLEAVIGPTAFDSLNDYLGIISPGSNLGDAEQQPTMDPVRETVLRRAIGSAPEGVDYIVIDAPSSLNFLTTCAITAADFLIIPVPCQAEAVAFLGPLLSLVKRVRQATNPGLRIAGVVFTQCREKADIQSRIPADILAGLQPVLLDIVITRNDVKEDVPAVIADVMSTVAEEYLELAAMLAGKRRVAQH